MNVLGIMSGTSIDGVDYALCSISKNSLRLGELWSTPFPTALRNKLHEAARGDLKTWEFCQLHHDLGRFYARHATRHRHVGRPQLIGLHGQTVFHHPVKRNPATFQLGEPAYLAEKFRVPVVSNFRAADLAAGGQGAPLATIFHRSVFAEKKKHVCVNNLGGISNVTSLDWTGALTERGDNHLMKSVPLRGTSLQILAFDTGPANMLTDFAVRHFTKGAKHFDKNGAWAARGVASEELLRRWLCHPFFKRKPPKSTGRELFGEPFFRVAMGEMKGFSKYAVAATLTEFTARSLSLNYHLHLASPPDKIILTGGGAANSSLVGAIRNQFPLAQVQTSDELGWPVEAIEPAAFALLAFLRIKRKAGNIPETTGATRAVLCGQISE